MLSFAFYSNVVVVITVISHTVGSAGPAIDGCIICRLSDQFTVTEVEAELSAARFCRCPNTLNASRICR